ncbi:MAG: efflux RND transporter periplasmic adaptor subunit [Verrucomicrobia bacterium]|nr:efflux RND transporter periplasmic adaptor subunit [Verrucomicrobiota bacterium]
MKRLLILLALAACSKPPPPPPAPPVVTVGCVEKRDMPIYKEYVGHVEAYQTVEIKAQVTGLITGQYFQDGAEVKAGDLLVTIDDRPFQASLLRAEGALAQAVANLRQAKEVAERNAILVQQQYISQLDYDQFVTNVLASEATVTEARADVDTAKINLGYCTIRAPIGGATTQLLIYVGNYVPVGGSPLMTINQIQPLRVNFFIPEQDLPQLMAAHEKSPVKILAYLQDSLPAEGQLYLVNNQVDENTGTILIEGLFPNTDRALWPGEYVNVRTILQIIEDATVVPSQAISMGQEGPYVYVVKSDHYIEMRPVKIIQREGEVTIIEKGVTPGETLVLEGQINLNPNVQVAIKQ